MNEFNIDIEKLNTGTYFINLEINNEILKCKFEVVRQVNFYFKRKKYENF